MGDTFCDRIIAAAAAAVSARRKPAKPIQAANEEVDMEEVDLTGDLSGGQGDLNGGQFVGRKWWGVWVR
ncbi:MAG: hypothetical protein M1839_001233 [Geoglossum umbratile]|nr:MAG: hypothetical protein M1839_001233 [Geoglossum umbratile]